MSKNINTNIINFQIPENSSIEKVLTNIPLEAPKVEVPTNIPQVTQKLYRHPHHNIHYDKNQSHEENKQYSSYRQPNDNIKEV